MDSKNYRVVWVHGIGNPQAGYSAHWRKSLNTYLQFPITNYSETLWATVFSEAQRALMAEADGLPLTSKERIAADEVYRALEAILLARGSAIAQAAGSPLSGEWSNITKTALISKGANTAISSGSLASDGLTGLIAFPDWILRPQDTIGEFVQYLVSRRIRTAVKAKLKEKLRPLIGKGYSISIIAHSWGTVVAYESLIDLESELPAFQLADLVTLGSPLWMVQQWLDERSGRKPRNTKQWVNIHARSDLIGSWLKPGFRVDKDFVVSNFGGMNDPHGCYFLPGNVEVQRDIIKLALMEELA